VLASKHDGYWLIVRRDAPITDCDARTPDGEDGLFDGAAPCERPRVPQHRRSICAIAFLDRKAALARLLNGQVAEDRPTVFERACQLGAEDIGSK
jgi:hypothetical protein